MSPGHKVNNIQWATSYINTCENLSTSCPGIIHLISMSYWNAVILMVVFSIILKQEKESNQNNVNDHLARQ
eukprot:snap_masked-scaffold_15-processed-gene-1.9-mRNA-1 protein AED:1.00 eAED:1.00 QI:0/0/0/0/1/1/2/0/70